MQTKRSINLCSIYILPLIGVNSTSFGVGNFITSCISTDSEYLVVALKQLNTIATQNPFYKFNFEKDGTIYAVFKLPPELKKTVELFREGKYSKFPDAVKNQIRKKSGLRYKVAQPDGSFRSARELLALDRDKELKKAIEKELEVKLSDDAELISVPMEHDFFELNLSTQIS